MCRFFAANRLLMILSAAWLTVLLVAPASQANQVVFGITLGLIAINAACSLWTLTRQRTVLIGVNCMQILLFGVLNHQLFCAFGPDHYQCDREPLAYDWIEFTVAHFLRAADVLDALDEYGIHLQTIMHASVPAGLILIGMHLSVDCFLLGLILRWLRRFRPSAAYESRLAQGRREFGWLLVTLTFFAGFGICQALSPSDWLLWPLDNLVRLVDVGDVMQVFGWRIHSVESNYWTAGAAVVFRLAAGIWMARIIILCRLTILRAWGVGLDELTEFLDDADPWVRRGAAMGLGHSRADAGGAVTELAEALRDIDPAVRCEAARALGRIGPPARDAVARLIDAAWLGERDLRLAAVEALGEIGTHECSAWSSLVFLLKVSDEEMREVITRALERIQPAVIDVPDITESRHSREPKNP